MNWPQVFFLQDLQDVALNLAKYVQDSVQDLASLARKILARFVYFLQDGFYWPWEGNHQYS